MAGDISKKLMQVPIESREFQDYYYLQVLSRNLNESAIIEIGADNIARTAAIINPDNRDVETRLPRGIIARLNAGEDVVVVREANRIEAATRMTGRRSAYPHASRDFNVDRKSGVWGRVGKSV